MLSRSYLQRFAFFARRLAAMLYDSFLVSALLFAAMALLLLCHQGESFQNKYYVLAYLYMVAGGFLTWCWSHGGQSLGALAWQLRLYDAEQRPLTYKQACWHYFWASSTIACGGLGLWWSLLDSQGLTLYERLAKTRLCSYKAAPLTSIAP